MSTSIKMPKNVTIKPRRLDMEFEGLPKNFINNNPVLSAFLASLSAVFPIGERQFIYSVRMFEDQVTSPELKKQIKAFIGQEAHHGREHDVLNQKLIELGWRTDKVENRADKIIKFFQNVSPQRQLAQTVALEHFTAIFANYVMSHEHFFNAETDPRIKRLLLWHSIEEVEHKAVAFDLYCATVNDRKLLKTVMSAVATTFMAHMMGSTLQMLKHNKELTNIKAWREARMVLFGKEGLFPSVKADFQRFYADDFHPWEKDDSDLAAHWLKELAI